MFPRMMVCLLLPLLATVCSAQQVGNGAVTVAAVGDPGAWTGFRVLSGDAEVAVVTFGSNDAITARFARVSDDTLRFSGLACKPTPTLGPDSFVEVRLLPDDPYPEVRFSLDLQAFDQAAWQGRFGEVPFHFLACSVPGAQVFSQRGWAIGTPVVDDYIQKLAEGPGKTVVSSWSRDWMYAPPIGAYPTAAVGLWNSDTRRYVGYDFHDARLTDHTEKNFGTTYCYKCGDSEQFFCLTWPFGKGYINLRYPETPVQCGTHFRLLWSRDMGPDDDPNRLVHEFIWRTYADLLPDVERMNDLSWLPGNLRINGFGSPGGLGRFVHETDDTGDRWWAPHVHIVSGVSYFSPVDYYFQSKDQRSLTTLAEQCRRVIEFGKWMDVGGDRCFYWQTPLDGGGAAMFGPGVETFHHISPLSAGLAMLDYYRNDPEGAKDLLPYIDGILNWVKHTLYTRNCYPDVPAAQFAWSATPIATFCLKYYYHFRADPSHRQQAELAAKLAQNMTYRYLALWPCDNDDMDDLDSSYMMEPNAGLPWLGCACANEIWVYNIAMLYEYLAFGDPIMGQYVRGMLERYHEMYQDQWYPAVRDYPSDAFTERFGLFEECAQGKGQRGNFGGLWGGFERLIWPMGSARTRIVCGEKAAMAFNKGGRHTDISDYRYFGDGNCSFRLVPGGLQADAEAPQDVDVTFPFFDLSGKTITVTRDGHAVPVPDARIVKYPGEPSTLTLKGAKLGDLIAIGRCEGEGTALTCAIAKPRTVPSEDHERLIPRDGFDMLSLVGGAFEGISRDWDDIKSLAGYEPGVKTLYGIPFVLLDPDLTQNRVMVPRQGIAIGARPQYLFVLLGGVTDSSRLALYRDEQTRERVDLSGAVPVLKGWPPVLEWHIDLVVVENQGQPIMSLAPTGCQVFAITMTQKPAEELKETLAAIHQKREQMIAHREMVKAVADLAPLFEPFSGHIAVLPVPGASNPRSAPLVKMLQEAGLAKHVVLLTKQDLVDPRVLNIRRIWIAFYVGGEEYFQTVNREGDGDEALRNWLRGGGTLVSLANGPFPFYYNEKGKPVVCAPKFGLPIAGSGANSRADTLGVVTTTGWEKPPEGVQLTFHTHPGQKVITSLPATIPWEGIRDPRWRPVFNVVGDGNRYTPLVTLKDSAGRQLGEAAALIEYNTGDLAGARVLYVWHSLRLLPEYERAITTDIFRYLLTHTLRPVSEAACIRAAQPPVIDGKLDDAIWQQTPPTEAFVRFDPDQADGKTLKTTARLAWDDANLYIAWECEDPDVWSEITQRDGNLWEGEVVEVYLDPDGDGKDYAELEISPLNNVVDLKIPSAVDGVPQDVENARKWNATDWRHAVNIEGTLDNRQDTDTRWTAETAIPLTNFTGARGLPPRVGDTWRVQLFRIDRSNGLPHPQFSAWSATDTFHNPSRFGRLIFSANPCADDFSAYAEGAAPTPTWAPLAGEWTVTAGELVGKNSGTGGFTPTGCVGGDPSWTDYRLSVRFQVRQRASDHRDGAWIGFRYADPGHCYCLALHASVAVLHKANGKVSSGDANPLATGRWATDTAWHQVLITVKGARISIDLDGQPLMDTEDKDALGVPPVLSGGVCLSARKWENSQGDTIVAFDDVKVETIP